MSHWRIVRLFLSSCIAGMILFTATPALCDGCMERVRRVYKIPEPEPLTGRALDVYNRCKTTVPYKKPNLDAPTERKTAFQRQMEHSDYCGTKSVRWTLAGVSSSVLAIVPAVLAVEAGVSELPKEYKVRAVLTHGVLALGSAVLAGVFFSEAAQPCR